MNVYTSTQFNKEVDLPEAWACLGFLKTMLNFFKMLLFPLNIQLTHLKNIFCVNLLCRGPMECLIQMLVLKI